jgi:hypothetical protein
LSYFAIVLRRPRRVPRMRGNERETWSVGRGI